MRQISYLAVVGAGLAFAQSGMAQAQDTDHKDWYLRGGPVGIYFSPGAELDVAGAPLPGADVSVEDNYSVSFDVGYRITDELSASFTFGVPPTAEIRGDGSLAGAYLGDVTYAPAILALQYRFPTQTTKFEPYVGVGINYTIILDEEGQDVADFEVDNAWGTVLQTGFESMVTDRMGVYFDVKKIWLESDVRGTLGVGGPPASGKATLDPLLVGAGVVWRF